MGELVLQVRGDEEGSQHSLTRVGIAGPKTLLVRTCLHQGLRCLICVFEQALRWRGSCLAIEPLGCWRGASLCLVSFSEEELLFFRDARGECHMRDGLVLAQAEPHRSLS